MYKKAFRKRTPLQIAIEGVVAAVFVAVTVYVHYSDNDKSDDSAPKTATTSTDSTTKPNFSRFIPRPPHGGTDTE